MPKKKKSAFTLAEILLTLVIVGVVAGLVLPSLLKDMQAKSRMNLLKSTLIGVDDVIHKEIAQKRSEDIIDLDIHNNPQLFLQKLNVAPAGTAFSNAYKNYNGNAVVVSIPAGNGVLLQNGVGIGIINDADNKLSHIIIDVTGEKPPNTVGIDYFIAGMTWEEDLTRGIHVGDVHGYINGTLGDNDNVANLRASCMGGGAEACFRLVELTGYEPEFLTGN